MSALALALHEFQKDAPPIHLDATNPHFRNRYASLGGVVGAIRPVLNKHGLVYSQLPTHFGGMPALRTVVIHAESGEELESIMPLILPKQDPQGYGSALTYARRYALLSILGLVGDEDDDANAATPRNGDGQVSDPHGLAASRADAPYPSADPVIHFGKNSGKRLSELAPKQLEWYATKWEPNSQYANETDRTLKAAAVAMRSGEPVPANDDLDDLPF